MYELRALGQAALLWADDDASELQNSQAVAYFLATEPKELLQELDGKSAPLVLKRRKRTLKWLEHCMDQLVTAETNASVSRASRSIDDDDNQNISDNLNDVLSPRQLQKLWRSSLSLFLAGRPEDARVLLGKAGPMLAVKLVGGAPAGFEKVMTIPQFSGSEMSTAHFGKKQRGISRQIREAKW
jgi:hypothetical protein